MIKSVTKGTYFWWIDGQLLNFHQSWNKVEQSSILFYVKVCCTLLMSYSHVLSQKTFAFYEEMFLRKKSKSSLSSIFVDVQFVLFLMRTFYGQNVCIFGAFCVLLPYTNITVDLFLMYSLTPNIFNHLYSRKVSSSIPNIGEIKSKSIISIICICIKSNIEMAFSCLALSIDMHKYEQKDSTMLLEYCTYPNDETRFEL